MRPVTTVCVSAVAPTARAAGGIVSGRPDFAQGPTALVPGAVPREPGVARRLTDGSESEPRFGFGAARGG